MKEVIECSASRLFNSVSLIWSKHINVEAGIDGDCEEDNARREYMAQERVMNGIVVSTDSVPDQEVDDDSEPVDIGKSTVEVYKFAVQGAWDAGKHLMEKENYLEVREMALSRVQRKVTADEFILKKVEELKSESRTTVGKEMVEVAPAPWRSIVHNLDKDYFN